MSVFLAPHENAMFAPVPTYRVSNRFLVNLCQQAFYGTVGVVVSWALFWVLSQQLLPAHVGTNSISWLLWSDELGGRLMPYHERELIRCLAGPGMAGAVLFGGLMDFLTWVFVRYEVRPDKLVMRWMWWSRRIDWDVVQTVQERPHAVTDLRSMVVSATGVPPILVRGLQQMPVFREALRTRVSPDTEWTPTPYRIDLTNRSTNFLIGFLLPIPIHATWLAGYVGGLSIATISVIWAWLLVAMAVVMWYWRPLSRRHMCAVEIELAIAALMLLLSGLFTVLNWLESGTQPPWAFLF